MARLFGTDGVRGVANAELTAPLAPRVRRGQAAVVFLGKTIVVGKDTRLSGDMLESALVAGIASATANNGRGVAGGAFNAKIVPVKVVNDLTGNKRGASTGSICRGYAHLLDAVDEGRLTNLRVVNISLGSYSQAMNDPLMHALISIARDDYGIVTVCAGGNDGVTDVSYPSDYD